MRALIDWLRIFSLREALASRGRAPVVVAVIAVSAALLVAVLGLIGSIDTSIKRFADGVAGNAQLEVTGIGDGGFTEAVLPDIERAPGVSVAVPMVQASVISDAGQLILFGADARSTQLNNALRDAITSRLEALAATADGVLAGPGVGVKKGDRLVVGAGTVTIVDVLGQAQYGRVNGGNYLLSPLRLAQQLSGRGRQLDRISIIPDPGADIGSIRSTITDAVAGRALVAEPQARAAQEGMGVNLVRFVAFSAAGFALVISGFLIFTATGMAIATRRPHLSMMRAIGARRAPMVAGLVGEAALYGLIGGSIGSAIGVVIGRAAIGGLPAAFMQTVNVKIEYHSPVWSIPVGIVVAVVASAAATALAARQVYKVSPIEALAPVGGPAADTVPHWMRYAAAGTAVVMAAVAFAIAMTNLGLISDISISIMFGAVLALGFAFGPALVALCGVVARCFGAAGTVAASAIARAPQRVWATMMTATIAVVATLAINGAGTNAVDSARQSFASMGQTDIWVSSSEPGLFPTGPLLPPMLRNQIADTPGVSHVGESQAGYATMNGSKVMMFGLAADAPSPLMVGLTNDERRKVLSGDGVVLSRDLAQRLNARTSDDLELQTAQGPKPVRVVAVVPFFSGLTGTLGLAIDRMRNWFNRPGDTALQIVAAPGVDHATLIQTIRGIAPAGVSVYSGQEAISGIGRTLQQAFELNNVSWMILVVISALALLNMLMLSVMERRRELGVLRAIGSSRRFTLSTILVEGLSIGVIGGLFGVAFGLVEQYVADFASTQVWSVDVAFRLVPTACLLALGAIGVCVLGSALPAMRAARANIVEAVSND